MENAVSGAEKRLIGAAKGAAISPFHLSNVRLLLNGIAVLKPNVGNELPTLRVGGFWDGFVVLEFFLWFVGVCYCWLG